MEETDNRHRWLLRARRERPRCRAADERDEVAPPDYSITSSAATSTTSLSSRLLGELAHGGTAGNSGIEQNVSTCGNIEKVIRYRPSISLVARQWWSSRAGEAAQHESGYPWPWHGMSNFFIPLWT